MSLFSASKGESAKKVMPREVECLPRPVQATSPAQDGTVVAKQLTLQF